MKRTTLSLTTGTFILLAGLSFSMCGCAVKQRYEPIKTNYLGKTDLSGKRENLPFMHSHVEEGVDPKAYSAVYVAPVRTDLVEGDTWEKSASVFLTSKDEFLEKTKEIGFYFRERLIRDFRDYPEARYKIADKPGPGVAVIEIALLEMEFPHPMVQAGSLAVPIPATGNALATITNPHAAMAMKVTDGGTKRLLATAADRKFPPGRLFDLNKLTVSSSLHEVCNDWSAEITDAVNKGGLAEVEKRGVLRLLPW